MLPSYVCVPEVNEMESKRLHRNKAQGHSSEAGSSGHRFVSKVGRQYVVVESAWVLRPG